MRRRWLLLGCAGVVWLGGCGAGDEPLPAACTDRAAVEAALGRAPEPVVLADGTRLSACIERAMTAADLQNLGTTLTGVAERLGDDPAQGERLGYLIGAVRRGNGRASGMGAELARRLERSGAGAVDPAAVLRGIRAGEASG